MSAAATSSSLNEGKEALRMLAQVSEHRKQYMLAAEGAAECKKLGRNNGPVSVERYLGELRGLFAATVNSKTKLLEKSFLAQMDSYQKSNAAKLECDSVEDQLYALMESWSSSEQSPSTISSSVILVQKLIKESCGKDLSEQEGEGDSSTAEAEADVSAEEEYQSLVAENNANEFPLGMLLEIAAKHYDNEYKSLLSESQMQFMTKYVSLDSDQFLSTVIVPLEENLEKSMSSLIATNGSPSDSMAVDQLGVVKSLLEQFKADRSILSNLSHKQHVAAMDFYLSLVDLADKINLREEHSEKTRISQ